MISKAIVKVIEKMDEKYVIGGSNAAMIYIGYDIRKCNDLDLHLSKNIDVSMLQDIIKMEINTQYDQPRYTVFNGIRVLKLEDIISYKINRLSLKDIYDLYFLLKLDFDINEIKIYSNNDVMEEREKYIKSIYKEADFNETAEMINRIRNQIMEESSTSYK